VYTLGGSTVDIDDEERKTTKGNGEVCFERENPREQQVQREKKKKSGSYEQSCRTRTRGTFKKVHRLSTAREKAARWAQNGQCGGG